MLYSSGTAFPFLMFEENVFSVKMKFHVRLG